MNEHNVRHPQTDLKPLVSVLVPSYNHEKYILECLKSIKSLTYGRLELIVSDDCSSDNTFPLAEQWALRNLERFEHCTIVKQEKNIGTVRNLQFLFNCARGDYLAYIASDDAFLESALERRVDLLQENRDIDAVFGNAQLISNAGAVLKEKFIPSQITWELSSNSILVSSLLINWCVPGPVMLLRKEAIEDDGSLGSLPDDLKGEDRYIYIRLASRDKLRYLDEVVAKYRVVQDSMSRPSLPSKRIIDYYAQGDEKNRHLLSGFNRLVIENEIAKYNLEKRKSFIALYGLRKLCLRCTTKLLRTTMRMGATLF